MVQIRSIESAPKNGKVRLEARARDLQQRIRETSILQVEEFKRQVSAEISRLECGEYALESVEELRTQLCNLAKNMERCFHESTTRPLFLARFRGLQKSERDIPRVLRSVDGTRLNLRKGKGERERTFQLDSFFAEGACTQQIYECIRPLVQAMQSYSTNLVLILDGHTGTGKSYTMFDGKAPIITSCVQDLLAIEDASIEITSVEGYRNEIRDLLNGGIKVFVNDKIDPLSTTSESRTISSLSELQSALTTAKCNRHTSRTDFNNKSSRSHAIYTIRTFIPANDCTVALTLVDLAGDEQLPKSAAQDLQADSTYIHNSRQALQKLLIAQVEGTITPHSFSGTKVSFPAIESWKEIDVERRSSNC